MSKSNHLAEQVEGTPEHVWDVMMAHVALPPSGVWGYQTEQHRRWHWLDYMMTMGALPPMQDDWDWVYMLGPYADHANCVFFKNETGGISRRRKVQPSADGADA